MPRGSHPDTASGLRERAARARRLALGTDDLTNARISQLAEELEVRASALEQTEQRVRHAEAAAVVRIDPEVTEVEPSRQR